MGGRSISGAYGQVSCVSFPIDRYNEEERQAVGTLEPFVVEMMWDGKRREERVVIHPNPHPKLLLSNLLLSLSELAHLHQTGSKTGHQGRHNQSSCKELENQQLAIVEVLAPQLPIFVMN
jgi:hypothetical protein